MSRQSWDMYFLGLAQHVATRTTCIRRRVGCVMVRGRRVLATGYNGAPSGAPHCLDIGCARSGLPSGERLDLCRAVHAEANALAQAARFGISLEGATAYVTIRPCAGCMRLLIQAGVERVVFGDGYPDEETINVARASGYETGNGYIKRIC